MDRDDPWQTAPWAHLLYSKGQPAVNPLRSVNIGGLFVLEPWITPDVGGDTIKWSDTVRDQYTFSQQTGAADVLEKHWTTWYTDQDFQDMASYGLNSIRLPVGWWYFAKAANLDSSPYVVPTQDISSPTHPITALIMMAAKHNLMVTIDLHGAPGSQNGLDNSGHRSMDAQVENWGDTWLYNATALEQSTKILVAMTTWYFLPF